MRGTRRTSHLHAQHVHSREPAKLCVGRCGRASIAVCRALRRPGAVPSAARVLLRRCAVAGAVARRLRSRAPPQECVGRYQRAEVRRSPAQRPTECEPQCTARPSNHVARAVDVATARAARAVTRPAHSTAALQRSCASAATAESASQFAAPPQQQCRGSQAGCAGDVTRGWRRAVHRAAERSRALPQCTAAEQSAALRAAERSRGDCRARPQECLGRLRSARGSARLQQSVTAPLNQSRRSRAALQECVGRCQPAAPPWHALMAIRRAPKVRGFTLARACLCKVTYKIH